MPCRIQMHFILICAKQSLTFCRRPKCAAASPLAPLRQSYPLPSPNACRLQNRRWQCAPRTSGWPKMGFVECAPLQRQHFRGSARTLLGLSPARGAHFDREWCSRRSAVLILLTYVVVSTIWGWQNGALACARCAFSRSPMKNQCFWRTGAPRTVFFGPAMGLSPQRGAHFD